MATANYNEVTNTAEPSDDVASRDPMFHWDTHFPERMSKLHLAPEHASPVRRARKSRSRNAARFKTQPITFDEIKEVDEEPTEDSKLDMMTQFAAFSRSMDGLVPNRPKPESTKLAASSKPGESTTSANTKCANVEPESTSAVNPISSTSTAAATYTVVDSDTAMMNAFRRRRRTRQQRSIEEETQES